VIAYLFLACSFFALLLLLPLAPSQTIHDDGCSTTPTVTARHHDSQTAATNAPTQPFSHYACCCTSALGSCMTILPKILHTGYICASFSFSISTFFPAVAYPKLVILLIFFCGLELLFLLALLPPPCSHTPAPLLLLVLAALLKFLSRVGTSPTGLFLPPSC